MCKNLFHIKTDLPFLTVYPSWLFVWNIFFTVLGFAIIYYYQYLFRKQISLSDPGSHPGLTTASLWVFPPLTIVIVMHAIVIFTAISGMKFN